MMMISLIVANDREGHQARVAKVAPVERLEDWS